MNLMIRQDIIDFTYMIINAQKKIDELVVSDRYSHHFSKLFLQQINDHLSKAISGFQSAVAHSIKYSEFEEIMNSIEKGGEE